MKRTWLIAAAAAHAAACSDTTTLTGTGFNLDRPIDVSFACYGQMRMTGGGGFMDGQAVIQTAQPIAACEALSPQITPTRDEDGDGKPDRIVALPGQEMNPAPPKWYAFILQSTAGTVAIGSWSTRAADATASGQSDPADARRSDFQVLDADPLTPGKNAIAIGEDPVAIGTDPSGCFELTANAGSCDLSELQINSVLANLDDSSETSSSKIEIVRRPVTTASTPSGKVISARPAAMIVQPGPSVADPTANPAAPRPNTAEAVSKMGLSCPAQAKGLVYVAYPSCHLVAGVEAGTGKLVSGLRFDANGGAKVLEAGELDALSCPVECSSGKLATTADPTPDTPRPVTLSYRFDARVGSSRLAIGADNSNLITVVDLDAGFRLDGSKIVQVELQPPATPANASRKLGVSSVALSPQIGIGGQFGRDNQNPIRDDDGLQQAQYVYAVASDATVRVVDLKRSPARECDTQIDGHAVRANIEKGGASSLTAIDLACMPYATPDLPRRTGARGPGIELPLSTAAVDAVPLSVAIVRGRSVPAPVATNDPTPQSPAPAVWLGYFAVISASTGDVYTVNVDDDYAPDMFAPNPTNLPSQMKTSPVLVMPHQLRDGLSARDAVPAEAMTSSPDTCHAVDPPGGVLTGGPRATTPPAQTIPLLADRKGKLALPTLLSQACPAKTVTTGVTNTAVSEVQFGAPLSLRDHVFPDLGSVRSETWTMVYESTLSLDGLGNAVDGPPVRSGQVAVDEFGMTLTDPARPFCEIGVQPFDIVELRGCNPSNGNLDCPSGYVCFVHPRSSVGVGACMLPSEAPQLADGCEDFLTTQRIYTAGKAADGSLVLLERKHELPNTPIGGCDPDPVLDQCNHLASLASQIGAIPDPDPLATSQRPTRWSCQQDKLRAPINADPAKNLRCVQTCTYVPKGEKPPDDALVCSAGTACLPDVRGGTGIRPGTCMEGVEPPQACVRGPQRYAVRASEAFVMIGAVSGYVHPVVRQADGSCSVPSSASPTLQIGRIPLNGLPACGPDNAPNRPNPCVLDPVQQFDGVPGGPIDCASDPALGALQNRTAPAIEFRNAAMVLTLVDPYKNCVVSDSRDPVGNYPVNLPMAPRGYRLQFDVRAGFQPFTLPLSGRTISPVKVLRGPSESIWVVDDGDFLSSQPTRGQVFRLESPNVNAVNVLQ